MRKIKFRAWSILDKVMIPDVALWNVYYGEIFPRTPDQRAWDLMQYTGLTDKNGKEIYEGDIVKFSEMQVGRRFVFRVEWQEGFGSFTLTTGGWDDLDLDQSEIEDEESGCEVIGNIYENSNLLDTQNKGGEV